MRALSQHWMGLRGSRLRTAAIKFLARQNKTHPQTDRYHALA